VKLVEIHILQTVGPNNLNRDDTNSPKDAMFGGYRRARISSQAQKRAVRRAFKDLSVFPSGSNLPPENLAVRTKRILERLSDRLVALGHGKEEALEAAENALNAAGLGTKEGKTEYLLFLGETEVERLAQVIHERFQDLLGQEKKGKKAGDAKIKKAVEAVLDGGKAVDLALFGRMLADRPELNVDAAAQVAHALSTHRVDREFDYYTAVDDLNPKEETGAGMVGDVEFYSATLYRYAVVDLEKLKENLQNDTDLAVQGLVAFLRAFALTLPSGKQNGFAAHNPPLFVAIRAGEGMPLNLLTAFEKPVPLPPRNGQSVAEASRDRLLKEREKFEKVYGPLRSQWEAVMDATGETPEGSLKEVLEKAEEAARALLGG